MEVAVLSTKKEMAQRAEVSQMHKPITILVGILVGIVLNLCAIANARGSVIGFVPATLRIPGLLEPRAALESQPNISSLDTQVVKDSDHVVLTIHATLVVMEHCTLPSVMVAARVNGVDLEPPFPAFVDGQGTSAGCSATGTFRIDLDAAEYAHPGVFLDQPLHIELTYSS